MQMDTARDPAVSRWSFRFVQAYTSPDQISPLEYEGIVSQRKTFVNEENTTQSFEYFQYFCA